MCAGVCVCVCVCVEEGKCVCIRYFGFLVSFPGYLCVGEGSLGMRTFGSLLLLPMPLPAVQAPLQ